MYGPCMLANPQILLDHAKQSATDPIKFSSKRVIQKTAEATGDLIGNKIANKITKVSKNLQQNNSDLQMSMSMIVIVVHEDENYSYKWPW